ncbi:MAG: hypothetical protein ACREBD_22000 [Blastocatellia bacterium]
MITARLDDCEVPEILAGIQWVDLFEDDGWQQLLQALEHQLKKDGKRMPLPVSEQRKRQQEEEEELKRRERQRQRELEEQQRRAEAAQLLAEQQRREQELAEQRRREQELAEQRRREQELAQKQRREQELAEQQRREQELAEQRRWAEEERKRKEEMLRRQSVAQQAPQKQPEQSRQPGVTRPNPLAFLFALPRSHKLFALAVLALAIISPIVYLWLTATRQSGEADAGTPAPNVTVVPATPAPSTPPAPVEVLIFSSAPLKEFGDVERKPLTETWRWRRARRNAANDFSRTCWPSTSIWKTNCRSCSASWRRRLTGPALTRLFKSSSRRSG